MTAKVLRSVTYTVDIDKTADLEYQSRVRSDIEKIRARFEREDIFVRTVRLNVRSIDSSARLDRFAFMRKVELLSRYAQDIGVRWFNVVFDMSCLNEKNIINNCSIAYQIIKSTENAFVNVIVANEGRINPLAALHASQLIINASRLSHNGYDNFRVGIGLNPAEGTPFFPFSYSTRDNGFSIAVETAQQIEAILDGEGGGDLNVVRQKIVDCLAGFARAIEDIASDLECSQDAVYTGIDMSIAPYPDEHISVIKILKMMGLDHIGASGTMFYTSVLTDIIKHSLAKAGVKSAGFNGVMYSLLEDNLMCEANNKKLISIDSMVSYSTMCGCGLDMVPVPGNILPEELAAIVLDVAAISLRLRKPLGVRVLPIPNAGVNEYTKFDMDFLTNTRIAEIKNKYLSERFFSGNFFSYFGNK